MEINNIKVTKIPKNEMYFWESIGSMDVKGKEYLIGRDIYSLCLRSPDGNRYKVEIEDIMSPIVNILEKC